MHPGPVGFCQGKESLQGGFAEWHRGGLEDIYEGNYLKQTGQVNYAQQGLPFSCQPRMLTVAY